MTAEELEIIITTNIQKALHNIRKVVKEVKNAVNETKGLNSDVFKGIDMEKVASDVSKATNTAIKETKENSNVKIYNMVEYKEPILKRILNKLKSVFHINKLK